MYISELKIDKFRSLSGVHLTGMKRVCIFHGENNSGKSNILAALEAILKGKVVTDAPAAGNEGANFTRGTEFYRGRLAGFSDNFTFGSTGPITFTLGVTLTDAELSLHRDVLERLPPGTEAKPASAKLQDTRLSLTDAEEDKVIRIAGELRYINENTCEAGTSRIDINKHFVLYEDSGGAPSYLGALSGSDIGFDTRAGVVDAIGASLTDAFQLIGADRAMTREKLNVLEAAPDFLSAPSFKRSLFQLSTGRDTYDIYKAIGEKFNARPFTFGDLSFSIDPASERLEIMIERNGLRLPTNRLGSGVQQILFLLSNILYRRAKMIGVEEIELNLSPRAQERMFKTIRSLVYDAKLINQALVTSHSPYAPDEANVAYFEVSYDDNNRRTTVRRSDNRGRQKFFSGGGGWEPDDF